MRLDDDLWTEVWDQTLSNVERHRISMSVLRREDPSDALERRIVPELARRWRRTARNHVLGHCGLLAFYLMIAANLAEYDRTVGSWLIGMTVFSVVVISVAVALRTYLLPVTHFDGIGPT